ncbi:MAG: aminotransferase class I/II-fold pyridoxal phosphate-dependent enzyme [Erysipelotrichaceae bacterium]|nr:aminotransferase class I/II-fold pyridoxal phosphate-dependent enzyme [Erysipelotrichaceae bacterium]
MIIRDHLNPVARDLPKSGIRKFFDLANTMEGVISLGVGEPDFDTPWHIRAEAIYAIEKGYTFYTGNMGLLELREAVSDYQRRRFNLEYDPSQILITSGASQGIDLVFRAILEPGDEVILVSPTYVAYSPLVQMAGGVPVYVQCKEENGFKLTKELLEEAITEKTKMLFLNFPGNPTGGVMTKEDYAELVPLIQKHELFVVSDEIYAELTYEGKHCSIASFDEIKDQVILMSGFSKAYSMTGWRMGYLCAHPDVIHAFLMIHQYAQMCPNTIAQYAAVEAAKNGDGDIEMMSKQFLMRRNYIVNGLNRIGLKCHMPKGAFYVFPSIQSTGMTSEQFCEELLNDQKVAVVPGNAFGAAGEGYVRISYAYSIDEIKEALTRIEAFLIKRGLK